MVHLGSLGQMVITTEMPMLLPMLRTKQRRPSLR